MIRLIAAVFLVACALPAAAQNTLSAQPYWKLMEGWWRAENTYMDGDLNYNIRSYNALIHVELDGRTYRETEYKFYAPSKLAQTYGRGQTTADEGIETVSIITGELIDDQGTVKLNASRPAGPGGEDTVMQVLSKDTGVRVTANPKTGTDSYRMFIFAPTPDKRYRSNFGLASDTQGSGAANALPGAKMGDIRGFSLFREDRIVATEVDHWRAEFRARNKVAAVVEPDKDGKVTVRRLK